MPMWTCDANGCQGPAVRTSGECILCNRRLCSKHLQPGIHSCPEWEDHKAYIPVACEAEERELTQLLRKINTSALASRASYLRDGIPCSIPALQYDRKTALSVMGGMNYHVEIRFEDGLCWLARIRQRNATSPPPALRDYIIRSEFATLQFLEKVDVPVPKVFDYALEGADNAVGVGYILMEKMRGTSLNWSSASAEQRKQVMSQLVDVFIKLHRFPFEMMGSLEQSEPPHIGPFAQETLTDFVGSEMHPIGPCSSLKDYHIASIRLNLELIRREEMYTERAVNAYLIHRLLLDMVDAVITQQQGQDDGRFYLKHADDKGDHILVDDVYNITGIVDWEWAHTTSKAIAFSSPLALLNVKDFYDGINTLSADEVVFAQLLDEKGSPELADVVRNGRLQRRFTFCWGYDLRDWDGFQGLFLGLRNAVEIDEGMDWASWKEVALHRYRGDDVLQQLLSRAEQN